MPEVAMIGAGSLVFAKTLMNDFSGTPALSGSEYSLMALTHTRLDKMHDFVGRMIRDNAVRARVTATTNRRQAPGRRLRRGHDPGRWSRRVSHRLRGAHEVRRGQLHRRYHGAGRGLPCPAAHPGPAGDSVRHARGRSRCLLQVLRGPGRQAPRHGPLSIESTKLGPRSAEYCSHIIEGLETGVPFRFNRNLGNDGFITNLPQGCCVEVPIYADRTGLHPTVVGALPSQCAALSMTNVLVQGLAVEASFAGEPELIVQAVALDPLTSAVLTLQEIRAMVSEMLEAQRRYLPQFAGKSVRWVGAISIPRNVVRQEVPTDPALAIANRFVKLAKA